MSEEKEHIYQEEEEILKEFKLFLKNVTDKEADIYVKSSAFVKKYEDLLENVQLITTISDRFQEKYKLANDKLKEQADWINAVNLQLDADNRALKHDVKRLSKEGAFSQLVDYAVFEQTFPEKRACLDYLSAKKWEGGYTCKKCGNPKSCDGNSYLSRRCTKCRYDESPTAFTLFHKCKFDLPKAFYISILIHSQHGDISSYEISRMLKLRQKTCWNFKQKIKEAIKRAKIKGIRSVETWNTAVLQDLD